MSTERILRWKYFQSDIISTEFYNFFSYTKEKRRDSVMTICEATSKRIEQLCRQKRLTGYSLTFQAGMPPSTFKSIMNGKSKNPGICNIKKIADGFGMTIREFFDSDIFNDLDQDD